MKDVLEKLSSASIKIRHLRIGLKLSGERIVLFIIAVATSPVTVTMKILPLFLLSLVDISFDYGEKKEEYTKA